MNKMYWFNFIVIISGCMATPIDQGPSQIVKYKVTRDGILSENHGFQAPVVWNEEQPILVQTNPLSYGAVKGGSLLTERDEQRHIDIDEEVENREDVSEEGIQEENEPKVRMDSRDMTDITSDDQKPVQTETAALLGSRVIPVKGGPVSHVLHRERDQVLPTVLSGQRRLVEPRQQYVIMDRSLTSTLGIIPYNRDHYQGLPQTLQQYKVSSQGLRLPVVWTESHSVQHDIPRHWLRKPVQATNQAIKGLSQDVQYVLQPVIANSVVGKQVHSIVNRPSQLQQKNVNGYLVHLVKQENGVLKSNQELDIKPLNVMPFEEKQKTHQVQTVKTGLNSQHSSNKVIIEESARHVPVVSGQRNVGNQVISSNSQKVLNPQIVWSEGQNVKHLPYILQLIEYPRSDIQQYYQVQSLPLQSSLHSNDQQNDNQMISGVSSQPVPFQYSMSVEEPAIHMMSAQQRDKQINSVQGIQGVQQIQNLSVQDQTDRSAIKGQSLGVNPLTVNQRSHVVAQTGVKGAVNV